MLLVTLLWSTAGVVTRHLDLGAQLRGHVLAQAFNAVALSIGLTVLRAPRCGVASRAPVAGVGVGPVLGGDVHRLHGLRSR